MLLIWVTHWSVHFDLFCKDFTTEIWPFQGHIVLDLPRCIVVPLRSDWVRLVPKVHVMEIPLCRPLLPFQAALPRKRTYVEHFVWSPADVHFSTAANSCVIDISTGAVVYLLSSLSAPPWPPAGQYRVHFIHPHTLTHRTRTGHMYTDARARTRRGRNATQRPENHVVSASLSAESTHTHTHERTRILTKIRMKTQRIHSRSSPSIMLYYTCTYPDIFKS